MNPSDQARQIGVVDSWLAQYRAAGLVVNPTEGVDVCTTGELPAGYYDVVYRMSTSVALSGNQMYFRWLDYPVSTNLWSDYFQAPGAASVGGFLKSVKVLQGEAFRVLINAATTGTFTGSIIAVRRA